VLAERRERRRAEKNGARKHDLLSGMNQLPETYHLRSLYCVEDKSAIIIE
jgi:hypothetical protein